MARTARTEKTAVSAKALRVLFIEDSPADVELCRREMKKAGFDVSGEVVASSEEFTERLRSQSYDLILADYRLPNWTGLAALEYLRQQGKDIPFILVTGSLGEETAVECIKKGAADYVLKDRLARLPVAVSHALKDKARRREAARLGEQIEHAKKEWELTFDTVPDPVLIIDEHGIQRANRAAAALVGLEPAQLIGKPCYEVLHGRRDPHPDCPHHHLLQSGKAARGDFEISRLGKIFDATATPLRDPSGALRGCVHVLHDITERKKAQEALHRSEARLQLQIERMPVACIVWSPDFRVVSWNPVAEETFGFGAEEVIGKHPYDFIVPAEVQPHIETIYRRLLEGDTTAHSVNENVTKDGRVITCQWSNTPLKEADGRVIGILSMVQDITERKRAEEALRRSEANYRSLILGATYGIGKCSVDGRFVTVNPALVAMLGYASEAELLAVNLVSDITFDPREGARLLQHYRQTGRVNGIEAQWKRKDGKPIHVRLSGRVVLDQYGALEGFELIAEDVSERKRLEDQFRQAQKLEAIGRLAGGVAHDFNNLLTIITGYSQLLLERLGEDNPLRLHATEIRKAADRAASLTRQLLAFSRRQVLAPQVLDLNAIVANMDRMLRRLIGEDIDLVTKLEPALGRVKADPGQIEQIILNLAVNARDAMPQGGKLTLDTSNATLDRHYARQHVSSPPGSYVMLAVSDTGCGMDEETQRHIFEPFFTTKEQGKGTGLGLATVHGIVSQSGGNIWVYSEPGKGTTFKIYLPQVEEVMAVAVASDAPPSQARGSETILMVEDDEAVQPLVRGVLQSKGYKVLMAGRGDEALKIGERYDELIHLLLTDVVMPQMSGPELARRLKVSHPETKVLYMSGYTDSGIVHHGVLNSETAFLQKPFTPDVLAQKVREVLDAPRRVKS